VSDADADATEAGAGSGRRAFIEALEVQRNARNGFAIGALVTAAVFVLFVVLPGGTIRPRPYYLGLAFVLVTALGLLLTAALTLRSLLKLNREL
jgi:hypothetical protein